MGLLGALFGGTVGFMLGGPLGMVIGGALGSQAGQGGRPAPPGARRAGARIGGAGAVHDTQTAFLVAVISLAAKVSKADGHVSAAEIRTFDAFLRDNLRLSAEERRHAARIFNDARDSAIPAGDFARQIRGILGSYPDRLRDIVAVLLQVAHADGRLDPAEETLIRQIARDMGLTDRDYQECRALFGSAGGGSLDEDYEALGVSPQATDDEVKSAYRRIAREYHPDVLQSKGLPAEFMAFANEKLQKVNAAYARIKKARSM